MSTTQQAALDAFDTREDEDAGDAPSEEPERRASPYARRYRERADASHRGEHVGDTADAPRPAMHDSFGPEVNGR